MDETGILALKEWESFYVIVGSSAGALAGLQFVVMTLITESGMIRGTGETLSAFGTPNVVHFCAVLLVSALFSAPWHRLEPPAVVAALCGVCGFAYSVFVLRRAFRQRDYKPVLEDWIWHATLPMLAYTALIIAGIELQRVPGEAMYFVGGGALLLVFVGIHNAWDTVTYVAVERAREQKAKAHAAKITEPSLRRESVPAAVRNVESPGPSPPRNPSS
jgi:hypothetical protein